MASESAGIEQVVGAVTAASGTSQKLRQPGKTKSAPAKSGGEGPLQGPEREVGKEPLARTEHRKAFDDMRKRYSATQAEERTGKPKPTPAQIDQEKSQAGADDRDAEGDEDEHSEAAEPQEKQKAPKKRASELEIAEARAALIRHGFRGKEIDAMPTAEMVQRGQSRMKADAAAAKASEKLKAQQSKGSHEDEAEEVPAPVFNVDALKPLAKTLGLEESEAKGLEDAFKKFTEPLLGEVAALKKQLASQAQSSQESLVEDARRQLVERFPELNESDQFDEVMQTMNVLAQLPRYKRGGTIALRVQQLMRDAAINVGLRELTETEEDDDSDADRAARKERRAHGRVTTDSRGTQKPATKDQADRAAFNAVRSGGDVSAARRAAGRD